MSAGMSGEAASRKSSKVPRLVVMASGRGSNLQAIIDAIEAGRLTAEIVLVLSDRPDAQALERARRHGIPAEAIDYRQVGDKAAYYQMVQERLDEIQPDLIVLAGYMRILPPDFVQRYPWRIVNIHPSLLPAFPGLNAQRKALAYGVKVAGCTVHFVDEGMDSGPIIAQAAVPVYEDDTEESLAARILAEEHRLFPEAIAQVLAGKFTVQGRRVILNPPQER